MFKIGVVKGLLIVLALSVAGGCRSDAIAPAASLSSSPTRDACDPGEVDVDRRCVKAEDAFVGPGGRVFVVDQQHPHASDTGPGTADEPWATISRAAQSGVLHPGDAVVIREGVYRESVRPAEGGTGPEARITYAAYPGETVIVSGADVANDGWTRQPDGTWRRGWDGPPLPTYSDDPVFRRELVVAAGRVLHPVDTRQAIRPGTFWVEGPDTGQRAIFARFEDDRLPEEVQPIEIATRRRLFDPVGEDPYSDCSDPTAPGWLRVIGLTLRHAANRAQWGAFCAGSEGGLVEDVRVMWTIGMGIDGSGKNHVFRRVDAVSNGQAGWGASCRSCVFEDVSAVANNWRGHDPFWEAGGGKWNDTHDTIIRRFYAANNDGPGIWLDGQNHANTIEDCLVIDNEGAGIMLELETTETLVQNNIVRRTRWRDWTGTGILSQAASRNAIVHNTVEANEGTGIWIRLDPLRRAPDGDNVIVNNWVVGNAAEASAEAREISIEAETLAGVRSNRLSGNVYGAPDGDPVLRSSFFAMPAVRARAYRGSDLNMWQRITGGDPGALRLQRDAPPASRPPARTGLSRIRAGASTTGIQRNEFIGANSETVRDGGTAQVESIPNAPLK